MAPVIIEMRRRGVLRAIVCATAQHRELLDEVHDIFRIAPDIDLRLMRPDQSLPELTAAAMTAIAAVVRDTQPAVSIVQGDTTSAMVGALASYYHKVPVAHVEAGLRTGDPYAPFPEEINRQVVGRIARWHFAPTTAARDNLLRENTAADNIEVTGNTSIDALQMVARQGTGGASTLLADTLQKFGVPALGGGERLVLVTAHRRESFGAAFEGFCHALLQVAATWPSLRIVYPVHPNPNVRGPATAILGHHPRIHLTPPIGYASFVGLLSGAWVVLTDSGGIQEEGPALGKPVLVLRDVTERPEAVEAGTAALVGTDPARIMAKLRELHDDPARYAAMAQARNPFGDGHAAERIVTRLEKDLLGAPLSRG